MPQRGVIPLRVEPQPVWGFREGLLVFLGQRVGLVGAGTSGSHRTGDGKHG
jgi:hypothetical protein